MKSLLLFIAVTGMIAHADLTIFDARKTLAMSDTDKVYRDFYINGGSEAGLSTGMVVTVERRLPLYDTYQNRSAGDLQLQVAKIKIVHVQKGLSVARLHAELTRDNAPLLEDNFIMLGDRLNMSTATAEGKKAEAESAPTPVAAAPSATPEPAQIVVNSVKIEMPAAAPSPTPEPVQTPVLQ